MTEYIDLAIEKGISMSKCKPKPIKYAFITMHYLTYKVCNMCKALNVSTSGYYKYINRRPNEKKEELKNQIKHYFNLHKTRSGAKSLFINSGFASTR